MNPSHPSRTRQPFARPGGEIPVSTSRIHAAGEMADRVREFEWSATSLGHIDRWPDLLLCTVNTLLGSRQPMFLWWGSEHIQIYNDACLPSLGADRHPFDLGRPAEQCWPEIWPTISPLIDDVFEGGNSTWMEDQFLPIYRNGKLDDAYWTFSYSPVWEPGGSVCGLLVVCSETTGRVRAEQSLLTERTRLLEVLQQAPAFFALLQGPDHVLTMVNSLYLRLVNNRDVLGKPARLALPEAVDQGYIETLDRVYRGERLAGHNTRYDVFTGEGLPPGERYVDFVYQPLRESDGTISGIILLGVDVTDRKKSQDALLQSEKLAAVGRLASSIAHEINNPLESVTNLLYLARASHDLPEIQGYLATAERELRRVAAISSQTFRFYKQSTRPQATTCADLFQTVLSIYQGRLINSGVEVEKRKRAGLPIDCFEGEIRQVLSNLVGNAMDAMHPSGGRLLVRSRETTNWKTGQKGIALTVADTGAGIPEPARKMLFQAFYTTKGISGNGLGLWLSKEVMDRHHGTLRFRSSQQPGRSGTVFTLFLPFDAVTR